MSLSVIPAFLLGYLVGSVPSAFLIVHWNSRVDIRHAGSGNVGALNSLEVTGSRFVGAVVLLLDLAKGMVAVWCATAIWGGEFWVRGGAGIGAVTGHDFPIWLGFRGGRGLSTAAGVMLLIGWLLVPVWLLLWLVAFLLLKEVNIANAAACLLGLAGVLFLPATALAIIQPDGASVGEFRLFLGVLFILLLLKLVDPVRTYFRQRQAER